MDLVSMGKTRDKYMDSHIDPENNTKSWVVSHYFPTIHAPPLPPLANPQPIWLTPGLITATLGFTDLRPCTCPPNGELHSPRDGSQKWLCGCLGGAAQKETGFHIRCCTVAAHGKRVTITGLCTDGFTPACACHTAFVHSPHHNRLTGAVGYLWNGFTLYSTGGSQ